MEELKKILASKGASPEGLDRMDADMLKNVAKAFGVDPTPYLPRDVKFEKGKNGAMYVVTSGYAVPKYKDQKPTGETSLAKNLYVRVEAIDAIIADLLEAKGLLKGE